MKTQATVRVSADFFLRPHLYRDKFPGERTIIIAPEVDAASKRRTRLNTWFLLKRLPMPGQGSSERSQGR
jgi:hypothetical protein